MPLITTPGDPDADSYVDLDEFKAYCGKVGYDLEGKQISTLSNLCVVARHGWTALTVNGSSVNPLP